MNLTSTDNTEHPKLCPPSPPLSRMGDKPAPPGRGPGRGPPRAPGGCGAPPPQGVAAPQRIGVGGSDTATGMTPMTHRVAGVLAFQ